jgi:RNA polymerase sigma-70 factor (ECF subfamily)
MERRPLTDDDARTILLLADDTATTMLADLPADQRLAVTAYVVDDRSYGEVAGEAQVSEAVVRQRVSRGLRSLRRRMGGGT